MKYRREWKHPLNYSDYLTLRQRLRVVLSPDPHGGPEGKYRIRSLYFDDPRDTALFEKLDGVNRREKFRIRCYNGDPSLIRLEKKSKVDSLCSKQSALLTPEQTEKILLGRMDWAAVNSPPLVREFARKCTDKGLLPKTIVEYTREAYVFPAGNVRVTMDYDLRAGLQPRDFLRPDCPTLPAGDSSYLLEVKYDQFLPSIVRDAVQLPGRRTSAFSKYAQCRLYG